MTNEYNPNHASPPGETLNDYLKENNISIDEFSDMSEIPVFLLNRLIAGKAKLTVKIAVLLEDATGIKARFWLNRERHYRELLSNGLS